MSNLKRHSHKLHDRSLNTWQDIRTGEEMPVSAQNANKLSLSAKEKDSGIVNLFLCFSNFLECDHLSSIKIIFKKTHVSEVPGRLS